MIRHRLVYKRKQLRVVRPRAAAIDRDEQYPADIVQALAEAGFLGMTMPKALGGKGASFLDAVLVIEAPLGTGQVDANEFVKMDWLEPFDPGA